MRRTKRIKKALSVIYVFLQSQRTSKSKSELYGGSYAITDAQQQALDDAIEWIGEQSDFDEDEDDDDD